MRTRCLFISGLALLLLGLTACATLPPPPTAQPATQPELTQVRIGTQPWIGYGPWWIAQEQGLFEKHGLQVELVDFVEDKEVNAALASGEMEAANLATHTAVKLYAAGLDIQIVLLEDASYEADAILAGADIKSIKDLAGRTVAYEEGATSDLLLNYALSQNDMTLSDITPINMPASDAGSALIAGRVDAAVTYEPYISAALAGNTDIHVIYTAAERPGLISDVLAVRTDFLKAQPDAVRALLQVWDEALAFYRSNPSEGQAIIARNVGSSPEELVTAFEGVRFYDLAENREQLRGEFLKTIQDVTEVSIAIGLLDEAPDLNTLIDASFLGEE